MSVILSVGWLSIVENNSLESLTGLETLVSISGGLGITSNGALTSISGLENLVNVSALTISNNNSLTSLDGLNPSSIIGYVHINNNNAITSLSGLEDFNSIGFSLNISGNSALASFTGLQNVNYIQGDLIIYGNNALSSFGLESLTSIGGSLIIFENESLSSLSGLEALSFIGADLVIGGCFFGGNPLLTDISGLGNLTSIGGNIQIVCNGSLTSLSGLDNIEANSILDLNIVFNVSLLTCSVKSICDYLAAPNGIVEIHDNAPGCNSPEEVDSACVYLAVEDLNPEFKIMVYPNPSFDKITIEIPETIGRSDLAIFNPDGRVILKKRITEASTLLDISDLPAGFYFYQITSIEEMKKQRPNKNLDWQSVMGKVVKR